MASPLLSLPREVRDSRPYLPRQCSYPLQATDTDFLSVISEIVIINDQPFHLHNSRYGKGNNKSTPRPTKTSGSGLSSSCKQLNLEYSSLLQRAALTPGTKTIAPVYDFNFSELISYVKTLRPHEIKAANRNENLVVNLFMFASTVTVEAAENLMKWIRCCEKIGIELSYVFQWTTVDMRQFKSMEGAIGGTVEGRKILAAIGSRNVKAWSWEGYQAGLKKERRS